MAWSLGGLCVDVRGVRGVYVTYACVYGVYIHVQGVHMCEGCTRIRMGAFAEVHVCMGAAGVCTACLGVRVWGGSMHACGTCKDVHSTWGGGTAGWHKHIRRGVHCKVRVVSGCVSIHLRRILTRASVPGSSCGRAAVCW